MRRLTPAILKNGSLLLTFLGLLWAFHQFFIVRAEARLERASTAREGALIAKADTATIYPVLREMRSHMDTHISAEEMRAFMRRVDETSARNDSLLRGVYGRQYTIFQDIAIIKARVGIDPR